VAYAELHCHSNFSFLDGAIPVEALVERALALGHSAVAVTDHQGLYGAVRFVSAAREVGIHPVVGVEIELLDAAAPDPHGVVVPPPRPSRGGRPPAAGGVVDPPSPGADAPPPLDRPRRPRGLRPRLPGHRPPQREDLRGVGEEERGPHLVLLARNDRGYRSLCRLISRANLTGSKGVPRFTHALLETEREGLVVLSGCRHGEIARRLRVGDRAGARAAAEWYARRFGDPTGAAGAAGSGFVLELEHHRLPEDDWLVAETIDLATTLGLPVVVTNDVHYLFPEDRQLHDVLTAIRHGRTLETLGPLRRPDGESYLKSEADLLALPPADPALSGSRVARAWREGISTAGELADRCRVELDFAQYRFPGFPVPPGETPISYLRRLCQEALPHRYHPVPPAALRQLNHELSVIERTGLAEFFLICWDLMRFARERGIPAQGRGSAADSIVAYLLGITRVDPLRHHLLFERFINEGRTSYPDVDIDFSAARREEVIQYVYERYGAEHTGMVCTVVTYRARSAVREVGYALGFPRPLVDRVAKALETYDSGMVRRDLEAEGGFAHVFRRPGEAAPDLPEPPEGRGAAAAGQRGFVDGMGRLREPSDAAPGKGAGKGDPAPAGWRPLDVAPLSPWDRWLELCARLDGFPRHLSIHTGGMLVTAAPLIDIAPLERATMPGRVVVQYDKRDIETLRLIKLDLLGLGMLAAIDEACRRIQDDCGVCLDLDRLPEEIPEVFAMLQAADTVGVFQVESRAQMQTLPKSRPATLDDLVVEVAIIRPGPIQGNAVHPYLRRRQGLEPVTYLHPALEPILGETLGVILYQEQVMRIAMEVAGFSAGEADGFRRAMGTWRSPQEMEKLHARFVAGCVGHVGMDLPTAEELFRQVAAFASFGFAKSHAAAFARTAYESAFLKLFYPAQFFVGLLNAQPMGFYPPEVLVNDARRHGVVVLPVDINASTYWSRTEWVGGEGGDRVVAEGGIVVPSPEDGIVVPSPEARRQWASPLAHGWGIRLGLHLVTGIGEERAAHLDAERARGPYRSLAEVAQRTGLGEEALEHLIRAGALDSLGVPRRTLLWQLREVVVARRGGGDRRGNGGPRGIPPRPRTETSESTAIPAGARSGSNGRVKDPDRDDGRLPSPLNELRVASPPAGSEAVVAAEILPLPPSPAPALPDLSEVERLEDAYAVLGLDPRRQVLSLFRPALDRLGVVRTGDLNRHPAGPIRVAGLVVTRQHPMTARGTVFLALEDETGMVNVTLWPAVWARDRRTVRRHPLLLVEGVLQRDGGVVNVVARRVRSLTEVAAPGDPLLGPSIGRGTGSRSGG
jgi:error-prone DNA polymerase